MVAPLAGMVAKKVGGKAVDAVVKKHKLKLIVISAIAALGPQLIIGLAVLSLIAGIASQGSRAAAADEQCGGSMYGGGDLNVIAVSSLKSIPAVALEAYQKAAVATGINWTVLAAVGYVESRHGGLNLRPNGDIVPPVIGPKLDGGKGVARLIYTGEGSFSDTFDRAVGPMQILVSNWYNGWGRDGNGDGIMNPQNYYDATFAGAFGLQRAGAPQKMYQALKFYGVTDAYALLVMDRAKTIAAEVEAQGVASASPSAPGSPAVMAAVDVQPVTAMSPTTVPSGTPVVSPSAIPAEELGPCDVPVITQTSTKGDWGSYENGKIPLAELKAIPFAQGYMLRADAVNGLVRLSAAYKAVFGENMQVFSAYRNYGLQAQLYAAEKNKQMVAKPGRSVHGWALAIDLGGPLHVDSTKEWAWLKANAGAYGWLHPKVMEKGEAGPYEPWHWQFGVA